MRGAVTRLRVFALILLIFRHHAGAAGGGLDQSCRTAPPRLPTTTAIIVSLASGALLWFADPPPYARSCKVRDGFLLVVPGVGWPAGLRHLPLLVYFWPRLSFTDAYFEAVSGLTTTGATVLEGLDALPYSINLWRAELVWLGGMGLIVLAVAILPLLGVGGRQIFKAESPGPMKDTKLTPRMAETAKGLWLVYFLAWARLPAGPGLGRHGLGRCAHPHLHRDGAGRLFQPRRQFRLLRLADGRGGDHRLHDAGRHELRHPLPGPAQPQLFALPFRPGDALVPGVMYASVLGIAWYLWEMAPTRISGRRCATRPSTWCRSPPPPAIANTDYNQWPIFAPLWMLFLCSFVTCSGSTGGGIKMMRAILLYKQVHRELLRAMHPNAVHRTKLGAEMVENKIVFAVLAFGFIYMVSIVSMTADAVGQRPGYRHCFFRRGGLHQQHRPRPQPGRPGDDLRRALRLPDLGVQLRHAAGPAGDLYAAGRPDARLLEKVTTPIPRPRRRG
jgi:trk system potassium uptake protein TrkH